MSSNKNVKVTTIDCFPNDGIRRTVYRYGGFLRNESSDSTNPLIEVLLIELQDNDKWINVQRCSTFLVPFLEIDTVQIGSIWEGNILQDNVYKFYGKLITKNFTFDFTSHKPKNIKPTYKVPNTDEYYMPLKHLMLPKGNDFILQGYPFTHYSSETYRQVNHCLMVSNNNIQVITSAVHILHSLFVNRKDIRGMVLSSSIQNIINRYLESYTTETVEDQTEYRIRIRKPYEDLGEIAIIFLANLALNEHVQNIVERLQHSMEITDFDPLQYGKNGTRYPIAFPPHPTRLSVEVEGLWLDDNKTRFFITRFKRVDPIDDHTIDVNQDHINTVPKDNEKNPIPREKSKNKNEHINTQKPPSRVNGEYRKRSDVESGNTNGILKYSFNEPTTDPVEVDSYIQPYTDKSEDVETSSDEPHGNEKSNIKKSETTDKPPTRDERFDIQYIIESLQALALENDSPLQKVYAINEFGDGIEGFNLLQIKELVPDPNHPSWIDEKLGRQLLFLKLELRDRVDHCYLIDIHKNKNHEAFCAFLIITPYRLTGEQIKKICIELESAKGIKKWTAHCEHFTKQIISLKHSWATPDEWKNKFKNLFKALNK
ncbi:MULTISPECIES: hypothetical protein [Acinetobacter]|uniref:hypothetical protein n=1 Tax=Acinetobacter TaxID=469 RepID=UPI001120CB3A|nr:hypothetical protein [Acinetobacter pullicarnis]